MGLPFCPICTTPANLVRLELPCLEDRAAIGDEDALSEIMGRETERAERAAKRATGALGSCMRWWCRDCNAWTRGEHASCAKCRCDGPHFYGEEAPTVAHRRSSADVDRGLREQALLNAVDRAQRVNAARVDRSLGRPAGGDDIPF